MEGPGAQEGVGVRPELQQEIGRTLEASKDFQEGTK